MAALTDDISQLKYHIDTFANSEDQAKTTFDELYDILDTNPKMQKFFYFLVYYLFVAN